MPDQSSASSEHALIQEVTEPLSRLPDDPLHQAADVEFPIALRGYDRVAVDAYVRKTSQLVAELQATRSPEAAVRRALERVGEEVSGILQRAHETAEQITASSRSEAEDRLEVARQEAAEIMATAEARVKELDAETDRIWAERRQIVEDVQRLAGRLMSLAETASERFPSEESVEIEAAALTAAEADNAPQDEDSAHELATRSASEADPEPPHVAFDDEHGSEAEDPPEFDPDATAVMPPIEGELP